MELDDDLFFAELSEQIALLIMDEEEDLKFPLQCQPVPAQGFQYQFQQVPQVIIPQPQIYYEFANKTESKGTGVFIPRFTAPRKKNKPGRNSNSNSNSNSQRKVQDKNRAAISNNASIPGQREKAVLSSH